MIRPASVSVRQAFTQKIKNIQWYTQIRSLHSSIISGETEAHTGQQLDLQQIQYFSWNEALDNSLGLCKPSNVMSESKWSLADFWKLKLK